MKKLILVLLLGLVSSLNAGVKENYQKHCVMCHGVDGKGFTKVGQKLDIKDYSVTLIKTEDGFKSIKNGLKKGDRTLMKPYEVFTDDEIKELVKFMQDFKKN